MACEEAFVLILAHHWPDLGLTVLPSLVSRRPELRARSKIRFRKPWSRYWLVDSTNSKPILATGTNSKFKAKIIQYCSSSVNSWFSPCASHTLLEPMLGLNCPHDKVIDFTRCRWPSVAIHGLLLLYKCCQLELSIQDTTDRLIISSSRLVDSH